MRATQAINKTVTAKRRYKVIAKVSKDHFVKYRTNYPDQFITFLVKKFPTACYANFFHAKGPDAGKMCATWGKHKGLIIN